MFFDVQTPKVGLQISTDKSRNTSVRKVSRKERCKGFKSLR